jgi:DNA-binding response OmpR family regulator
MFEIFLPVASPALGSVELEAPSVAGPGGVETVLLAEDEPAVRALSCRVLQEAGYTVIVANDGLAAVKELARHLDRIDLLIVDVIMPGKSGKEVAEEAMRMKPGIKVLYTSGYPHQTAQVSDVLSDGMSFLAKPAAPDALLRKVREVLDR